MMAKAWHFASVHLTPMTWFVILTGMAIGLALGLPPDPHAVQQLHTSQVAYRLAVAALLVPYVFIWYTGFYAFAKLQEYSHPLKDTKDGAAFYILMLGMGTLAFSLIVPTIISLILSNIAVHHPVFKAATTVTSNYLSLFPGLAAFLLLYNGARQLVATVSNKARRLDLRWYAPVFLVLSITFSHLTIENSYRSNPYHMNVWILVVTFIAPYLYAWMLGLLAAYELRSYAKAVKGLLYQRAVRQLANGIAVAIVGSIAVQFVNVSIAHHISSSLLSVLLLDYGLLLVIATGLLLMAVGTKKLKRIEEVL